jgi:hypothetical protein
MRIAPILVGATAVAAVGTTLAMSKAGPAKPLVGMAGTGVGIAMGGLGAAALGASMIGKAGGGAIAKYAAITGAGIGMAIGVQAGRFS